MESLENCKCCGKDLNEGDRAIGTTGGDIDAGVGGFAASSEDPWLDIVCPECDEKRQKLICTTGPKMLSAMEDALERLRINNCEGEEHKFIKELEEIIAEGKEVIG